MVMGQKKRQIDSNIANYALFKRSKDEQELAVLAQINFIKLISQCFLDRSNQSSAFWRCHAGIAINDIAFTIN